MNLSGAVNYGEQPQKTDADDASNTDHALITESKGLLS